MIKNTLRTSVQNMGMVLSRRLFTKRVLDNDIGKDAYLLLYRTFKCVFELKELNKLSAFIQPGGTVLDIGANVGVTALFFSKIAGPTGRVLAFEPDPIAEGLFRYHMKQRQKNTIQLFPVALGAQDGSAILFQNASNRADNRMALDTDTMSHTEKVSVQVRSISSLATESPELFTGVTFIKIDVQGYETNVITGMKDWLLNLIKKPVIHIEVWPYGLKKAGSSAKELLSLCESLGYIVESDIYQNIHRMEDTKDYMDVTLIPTV